MSHATTQIMGGRPTETTQHVYIDTHAQKLLMSFGWLQIRKGFSKLGSVGHKTWVTSLVNFPILCILVQLLQM